MTDSDQVELEQTMTEKTILHNELPTFEGSRDISMAVSWDFFAKT